jgi:hypothetical protein
VTGTANVKPAKTDAELARNLDRRITATENPTAIRAGDWVFSTSPETGNLIASHVNGGSVVLATPPPSEQDPDEIGAAVLPFIKARRTASQNAPQNVATTVLWDSVDKSSGGWGSTVGGFSQFNVPEDGVYAVFFHLAWTASTTDVRKAILRVNGSAIGAQEFRPQFAGWFPAMYIADMFSLKSGDIIEALAFNNTAGGATFGASTADTQSYTSMSIVKLR